ncbi:MAG: GNAT family N-acetyltransferase [Bacteroidia bacterium]
MITFYPFDDPNFNFETENLFHSKSWLSILKEQYNYEIKTALNTETSESIIFAVTGPFPAQKIISLPFSDYTIPNVTSAESLKPFMEALVANYLSSPIIIKAPYSSEEIAKTGLGKVARTAMYHRVETAQASQIEPALHSSFKRGIRKAEKSNVKISIKNDEEALWTFYKIYHDLRLEKFNSIPQPYSFFKSIFNHFIKNKNGWIFQAEINGEAVASAIVLKHKEILFYKFGASALSALEFRPNNLLFFEMLIFAAENGFEQVDLGLSGTGESYKGLVRFKESMGGQPHPITWVRHDPAGYDDSVETAFKAVLGKLTDQIVKERMSPEKTSAFSEIIYPFFA